MKFSIPAAFALAGLGSLDAIAQSAETMADANLASGFAGGEYVLPPLGYATDALEPHIDKATMELHHGKHHASYVTNLNKAVRRLGEIKGVDADPGEIESLQRDISFNAGGHVLHSIFWNIMGKPADGDMGGEPAGPIADRINKSFGDFVNLKAYFTKVAMSVKGSGWAVLAVEPVGRQLLTFALGDQDTRLVAGATPILLVDVWEHAYYLKYQNKRADYLAAWFNTINWSNVNTMLTLASR